MISRQQSKLSMFLAVKDFLTTNTAIVTPLPNYSSFFTPFQASIVQIQNFGEQQMFDKSGLSVNKEQLRNILIALGADASRKLQAYATFVNNQLLLSETKFTDSDLKRTTDNELRDNVQGIYDRAQTNLTALTPYGITAATQTTLLNAINAFVVSIPKPRIGTTDTKQSTFQLANAFKAAEAALTSMDIIIEIIKVSQPTFYTSYKSVRKIIKTGSRSLAVRGLVTDAASGEPLKNVKLLFALGGNGIMARGTTPFVKMTAQKGRFNIKSLAASVYNVTISKIGYADQVTTLAVSEGELSELNILLAKN